LNEEKPGKIRFWIVDASVGILYGFLLW